MLQYHYYFFYLLVHLEQHIVAHSVQQIMKLYVRGLVDRVSSRPVTWRLCQAVPLSLHSPNDIIRD